jgi:hypothetical protein
MKDLRTDELPTKGKVMRVAYLDCFSGISGNMMLGALIDAGLELDRLRAELARLNVSGYSVKAETVQRGGLRGTHVTVEVEEQHVERHLHDIEAIITASDLPQEVQQKSVTVFRRLAAAEARVHGTSIDRVHFHEVGALDAIVDVVGSVIGLKLLGVEKVFASPVHVGGGTVECAHGLMPVPAPATVELLKGVTTYGRDVEAELVTPTGAAILTVLVEAFDSAPAMDVEDIGYGAGTRDLPHANLLRIAIGQSAQATPDYDHDVVTVIETNIDDMNPEFYEHVMNRLFEAGALDVFLTPIVMKQSRPAVQLSVLTTQERVSEVVDILFAETTTIGVRFCSAARWKLGRRQVTVETLHGPVVAKVAYHGEKAVHVAPEVQDCRRIATARGVPLRDVYEAAQEAARALLG